MQKCLKGISIPLHIHILNGISTDLAHVACLANEIFPTSLVKVAKSINIISPYHKCHSIIMHIMCNFFHPFFKHVLDLQTGKSATAIFVVWFYNSLTIINMGYALSCNNLFFSTQNVTCIHLQWVFNVNMYMYKTSLSANGLYCLCFYYTIIVSMF